MVSCEQYWEFNQTQCVKLWKIGEEQGLTFKIHGKASLASTRVLSMCLVFAQNHASHTPLPKLTRVAPGSRPCPKGL